MIQRITQFPLTLFPYEVAVCMGVITDALVTLLATGVGLFEGFTAGVEAPCSREKAMG